MGRKIISYHKIINIDIPPAHYQTVESLINAINTALEENKVKIDDDDDEGDDDSQKENDVEIGKKKRKKASKTSVKLSKCVVFKYNTFTKKIKVSVLHKKIGWINFSNHLAYMLGFSNSFQSIFEARYLESEYMPDMSAGINMLYVYSDIVQPQLVGNSFSPLMRLIHVEGTHGSSVEKVFFNRQYIPIMLKDFSEVEIHIKTDGNQYVEFDSGKVIITLHFQRRRILMD